MFADEAARQIKRVLKGLGVDATFKVTTANRTRVFVDISGVSPEWLYVGGEISEEARELRATVERIAQMFRDELPHPYPYDTTVTFDYKINKPVLQNA